MSNTTTYLVLVNGEQVGSKSKKALAVTLADSIAAENTQARVSVVTSGGTEVHVIEPAKAGRSFRPWTRTETHDGIEVEVPAGYVVAYTRARVGAVVARAEDKSGWLVITAADGEAREAKNTIEAREITNQLAATHREQREAEKEARAKEVAERKAQRAKEREEAKAAKEAAKAAKAAEKSAA